MMKTLLLLSVAVLPAFAAPIMLGPIYMSGAGEYDWGFGLGSSEHFTASGSNGSDTVSLNITSDSYDPDSLLPFPGLPSFLGPLDPNPPCHGWSGSVTIDGTSGGACSALANTATWSLGDGFGIAEVFDPNHNLLILSTLIGFVGYTSEVDTYNGTRLVGVSADFDIVPTPEPGSAMLVGLGLAGLLGRGWFRRTA